MDALKAPGSIYYDYRSKNFDKLCVDNRNLLLNTYFLFILKIVFERKVKFLTCFRLLYLRMYKGLTFAFVL